MQGDLRVERKFRSFYFTESPGAMIPLEKWPEKNPFIDSCTPECYI